MRTRRFTGGEPWFNDVAPGPEWTFQDRSWNTASGVHSPTLQLGTEASFLYKTSSAGLTQNGRAFDTGRMEVLDSYNLPAYGVDIETSCGHQWTCTYEQAAKGNWVQTGACYQTEILPDGTTFEPAGTSHQGCPDGYVAPGYWTYYWKTVTQDWAGIDMTKMGRTASYDTQTDAQSGGTYNNTDYWDSPAGIWVPVIEVQSVLRSKCVSSGECQPPAAEPGSLAQ
jgi:hypothetical protein